MSRASQELKPPKQPSSPPSPPKPLDRVRQVMRLKYYSYRTEQVCVDWIRRFILFHGKRHPQEMGAQEIEAFLTHLAVHENMARARRSA